MCFQISYDVFLIDSFSTSVFKSSSFFTGRYVYAEASNGTEGDQALLLSIPPKKAGTGKS